MSEHCGDQCPLCRHKQSLDPALHTQLPTLGAYIGTLARASAHSPTATQCSETATPPLATADGTAGGQRTVYSQYVDPTSVEKEGFIFPENFLSEADRLKAMEYRKKYRSWRLKANHGSHGEFSKVVELMPGKPELRPLAAPRKAEPLSAPDEKQKDGSGRAEPQHELMTMTQEDDDPMQAWLSRMVSTGSEALMPLESRSSSLGMLSSEIMHSPKYSLKRHHTPSDDVDVAEDDARKRQCAFDFFAESMHSLRAEEQLQDPLRFLDACMTA